MALQHLRASVANKRPAPSGMSDGQLAINTNDESPGLFFKNAGGTLVKIGPVHVGTTAPNASPAVGGQAGNSKGEQWLDTSNSRYVFKIWDGTAWRTEDGEFVNASGDTMTGVLAVTAGTAALPGLAIANDPNTGIYSPGADQLAISTNGTERVEFGTSGVVFNDGGANYDFRIEGDSEANLFFVDASTDRVGLGTNSPSSTLHVQQVNANGTSSNEVARFISNTAGGLRGISISAPGDTTAYGKIAMEGTNTRLGFWTGTTSDERLSILGDGKVGIGTSSPTTPLQVVGTVTATTFVGETITTSGTTTTATLIASGDIRATSFNGGALAGMRNRIINGGMDIAQRGTSFAAIAGGTYSLDRWGWQQSGAMVCTVSQSTDVPNDTFQSSYKVDVTTVDSSIAAGDYAVVSQSIEGYNVRDLIGATFTLSFWVKSPKTGTHCVTFRNSGLDRAFVKEYTIVTANTWEYKTLTVTGGLITAGTWNWTSGKGLDLFFALAAGSTFQTTADAWQTGDFIATANQVNVMDNTANEFFITGVQLEPGPIATPFERRIYGQELALCQRYYETGNMKFWGYSNAAQNIGQQVAFSTKKRAAPSIVKSAEVFSNISSISVESPNVNGILVYGTLTATGPAAYSMDFTASAEL